MTLRRRVSIAGRGAASAFGLGAETLIDRVFAGETAIAPRARTAAFRAPTSVCAEFPTGDDATALQTRFDGDLALGLAYAAATEAINQPTASIPAAGNARLGLFLASTKGDLRGLRGEPERGLGLPGRLGVRLQQALGWGPESPEPVTVSTACASGLVALALAVRRLARGELDRALVVGVDVLTEFILAGFGSVHALDPGACRPFDAQRRGVTLGDGAGALLLSALKTESLGVLLAGHGGANDAAHVTRPRLDGSGLTLAAQRALHCASLSPQDMDVLHLHGTGTEANDLSEAHGMVALFGGETPPAYGTKAQTGHTLGASGVLETLLLMASLERGEAPANRGLGELGVDARLQLLRTSTKLPGAHRALKVAGGFGGVQAALVLEA